MLWLAAKCLNGSRKKVKITLPLKQNIYDFKINSLSAPKKNYEWIIFSWHLCGLHEFPVTPRLSGFFGYPSWFSVYSIKFSNCISFFWPKKRLRRRLQKCLLADRNEYQSKKSRSWNSWSKKKKKKKRKMRNRIVVWAGVMFSGIPKLMAWFWSLPGFRELCFF